MIRGIRRVALVLCDRLDDARITVKTHVDHLLHDAAIDNDSGVIRLDLHFESCRCLGVAGEPLVFQDLVKRDALAWLDLEDAVKEILELWSERFRQDVAAVEHESMLLGETALRWKGQLADKHHIETHAKAPDVDFLAVGFAAKELGGRVRHASTVREKMLLASQVVAQAKIDDLDLAAKGEHQVFHFQVTVDNLILVQVLECMDELATVPASLKNWGGVAGREGHHSRCVSQGNYTRGDREWLFCSRTEASECVPVSSRWLRRSILARSVTRQRISGRSMISSSLMTLRWWRRCRMVCSRCMLRMR
eukprot:m.63208 g.63208  ORF g.63208 m.63208 type:complete len:307 (+) comp7443_c0_seq3:1511-2431(+)